MAAGFQLRNLRLSILVTNVNFYLVMPSSLLCTLLSISRNVKSGLLLSAPFPMATVNK